MEASTEPEAWSRDWWARLLRESFGATFWVFAAIGVVLAASCYIVLGPAAFDSALATNVGLLGDLLPKLAAAQVFAGFVWFLLPRDRMTTLMQKTSGRRGLAIATVAGIITPGGPMAAFPFLAVFAAAGADRGVLVSYITSWALLGMQRIVVWDVPFMGVDFSALRFLISLPMPILAGMIARRLPFTLALQETARDGKTAT